MAVVGISRGDHDHAVEVDRYDGNAWQAIAALPLPEPSFDFATDRPVEASDVTGDGRTDFLFRFVAADNVPGAVVSDHSGAWKVVSLSADPADVYAARDAGFAQGHLETIDNDCTPDCAGGHETTVSWRYSPADGFFRRTG